MASSLVKGIAVLAGCALLSGCYRTTVRSGKPAAPATVSFDGKWHSGVVYGLAELSGPYDLKEVCPNGWAEVTTETSFVAGLVTGLTYNLYTPQEVTVRCAAGGSSEEEAPMEDAMPEEEEAAEGEGDSEEAPEEDSAE